MRLLVVALLALWLVLQIASACKCGCGCGCGCGHHGGCGCCGCGGGYGHHGGQYGGGCGWCGGSGCGYCGGNTLNTINHHIVSKACAPAPSVIGIPILSSLGTKSCGCRGSCTCGGSWD